jgi:hypothetical protein
MRRGRDSVSDRLRGGRGTHDCCCRDWERDSRGDTGRERVDKYNGWDAGIMEVESAGKR